MVRAAGFDGELVNIGVHRAYQVRHGAGPMPTADPRMNEQLLPGSSKAANRYQGEIRVGPLDTVLLRYALSASGGAGMYQALAITWFDQVAKQGVWEICRRYRGADDTNYFTSDGELRVRCGEDGEQLAYQEQLGQKLLACHPDVEQVHLPQTATREELVSLCADVLSEQVSIPVRMVSFGTTEDDKVCI
jgi:adenylosuccinate synthase